MDDFIEIAFRGAKHRGPRIAHFIGEPGGFAQRFLDRAEEVKPAGRVETLFARFQVEQRDNRSRRWIEAHPPERTADEIHAALAIGFRRRARQPGKRHGRIRQRRDFKRTDPRRSRSARQDILDHIDAVLGASHELIVSVDQWIRQTQTDAADSFRRIENQHPLLVRRLRRIARQGVERVAARHARISECGSALTGLVEPLLRFRDGLDAAAAPGAHGSGGSENVPGVFIRQVQCLHRRGTGPRAGIRGWQAGFQRASTPQSPVAAAGHRDIQRGRGNAIAPVIRPIAAVGGKRVPAKRADPPEHFLKRDNPDEWRAPAFIPLADHFGEMRIRRTVVVHARMRGR